MLKKDLKFRSPVEKTIGLENVRSGRFGAVLSRAGVGKTSFLVQIALTRLLSDEKTLHVSLDDSIEKLNIRYQEGYANLVDTIGYVDPEKADEAWEQIHPNKVGIAYTPATFSTGKIKDYLDSFKKADLKLPTLMVIDGLDFDQDNTGILAELEKLSTDFSIFIWFSIKSHREQALCDDGYPVQLEKHKEIFDKAIFLQPVEDKIEALVLKDGDRTNEKHLLDPATMMPVEN